MRWDLLLCAALVACGPKTPPEGAGADRAEEPRPREPRKSPVVVDDRPLHEQVNEAVAMLQSDSAAKAQRALETLEALKEADPDAAWTRFNLGVAYDRLGDPSSAEREYKAAVAAEPTLGAAWRNLGALAWERGDRDQAIATYRQGVQASPENMQLRGALVDALRRGGQADAAIREAKAALAEQVDSLDIYNALGLVYLDLGQYALAQFVFQKAIQSIDEADDDAWLNTNLGWSYYLQGHVPNARYRLEKALKSDPDLVPALTYLAHIQMDDHNYADALALLERAAAQAPDNPELHLNLGICYRGMGRFEDAKMAYGRALQLRPDRPEAHFNLGVLFGDSMKDYDAAVKSFGRYIEKGGPDAALAEEYSKLVEREKQNAARRAKADEARKKREAERAERDRLLEDSKKNPDDGQGEGEGEEEGADEAPEAEEAEADEGAAPGEEGGPWGETEDEEGQ